MPKIYVDFERMSAARKSVEALKDMGYKNAHLDVVDKFYHEYSAEINASDATNASNHRGPVLNSKGFRSKSDSSPLIASNPLVGGVDLFNEIVDGCTRLWVTVEDDKVAEIRKLLADSGGNC